MLDLWTLAHRAVGDGDRVALAVVVENVGSVPGKKGTKLVITPTESVGTIGGGAIEQALVERVRSERVEVDIFTVNHDGVNTESICSGHQKVAVLPLSQRDLPTISSIVATCERSGFGSLSVVNGIVEFTPSVHCEHLFQDSGDGWTYGETIGFPDTLTIVGAGHVAKELCRTLAPLPFRLRLLDDRPQYREIASTYSASELDIVDYARVTDHVPTGPHSYAVIMTYAHLADQLILEQLAPLDLAYLGMMGSASKVRAIFDRLVDRGLTREALGRVHSPIGVPIGSRTPAEIAISIAAEIIKVRNSR